MKTTSHIKWICITLTLIAVIAGIGGLVEAQNRPATAPAPGAPVQSSAPPPQTLPGLPGSSAKIESQLLVNGEPGLQFVISPRGVHVAAVTSKGSRVVVTADGVEGPRFDEILQLDSSNGGKILFSMDGSHYTYVGRIGQEYVVMMDQKEMGRGPLSQGVIQNIGFTPGYKHHYYISVTHDSGRARYHLVVDGAKGPESNELITPLFSPNGEHHTYTLFTIPMRGNRSTALIVDGKPAAYQGEPIQYTADSLHLFTQVQQPGAVVLQVDGKQFMKAQGVRLFLAPAGNGFVAVVSQGVQTQPGGSQFLVIGTQKVPGSDCLGAAGINQVFWSSDGKHWAARCQATANSYWVMADGKKGLEYTTVGDIEFTAEGKPVYLANNNNKNYMVVGDAESDGFATITRPIRSSALLGAVIAGNKVGFIGLNVSDAMSVVVGDSNPVVRKGAGNLTLSPDGSRYAFNWTEGVNVDGVDQGTALKSYYRQPSADVRVGPEGHFVFSPDSKHLFYFGSPTPSDPPGVIIDGKYLPIGRGIPSVPTFTPDSKHIFWEDREEGSGIIVYLDGKPTARVVFNGQNQLRGWWEVGPDGVLSVITQDGNALKRLRITPSPDSSVDTLAASAKALPRR